MSSKTKAVAKEDSKKVEKVADKKVKVVAEKETKVAKNTKETKKGKQVEEPVKKETKNKKKHVEEEVEEEGNEDDKDGKKASDRPGKHNKRTATLGLVLDVGPFEKWAKSFVDSLVEPMAKLVKKDGTEIVMRPYTISEIMSGTVEMVCAAVLTGVTHKIKKAKNGLCDLDFDTLYRHVTTQPELKTFTVGFMEKYDSSVNYAKNLPVDERLLKYFIDKHIFHDNTTIKFNRDTTNLLNFVLYQTLSMLLTTAFKITYSHKKASVNDASFRCALYIHFSGKILGDILAKLENVSQRSLANRKEKAEKTEGGEKNDKK